MRLPIALIFTIGLFVQGNEPPLNEKYLTFVADATEINFNWKDNNGQIIGSFRNLKSVYEAKSNELRFATNGGMFMTDYSPLGLYIENGKVIRKLNERQASNANFYLKPNGVFYITKDNKPSVCRSEDMIINDEIKYATQSGPMLVINGKIHPSFKQNSKSTNIRNGVGILPNNKVLFVISKELVTFHELAEYFISQGCKNALYLDGGISMTYLPESGYDLLDSNFGIIISVGK